MSKKKPPKVTVTAGRITGSVIIKGPTRAELTAEQSATARKAHYAATELDDDAPLPKGDWEE